MLSFAFAIGALLLWSLWAFFPKLALRSLPWRLALAFEVIGGIIFGIILLFVLQSVRVSEIGSVLAIASGLCNYVGVLLYLRLLRRYDVGYLATITGLYPAATVVFASILLNEPLSLIHVLGVMAALVSGVVVSLPSPQSQPANAKNGGNPPLVSSFTGREEESAMPRGKVEANGLAVVIVILLLWGAWGVLPRAAVAYLRPSDVLFHELLGSVLVLLGVGVVTALRSRRLDPGETGESMHPARAVTEYRGLAFAALAGFCAFSGMYLYAQAVNLREASIMAPLTGMYPVGAFILGGIFLRERVTAARLLGVLIAMIAIWLLS